jgi:hypothetical protein
VQRSPSGSGRPAYCAVCQHHLLPAREEIAQVVGDLLLELGPEIGELEATFDEEVAAAEGPMWQQLVADAKCRLVCDACAISDVRRRSSRWLRLRTRG